MPYYSAYCMAFPFATLAVVSLKQTFCSFQNEEAIDTQTQIYIIAGTLGGILLLLILLVIALALSLAK